MALAAIATISTVDQPQYSRPVPWSRYTSTRKVVAGEPAKWRKNPFGPWRLRS
jgi:hypothetical protein